MSSAARSERTGNDCQVAITTASPWRDGWESRFTNPVIMYIV